MKPAAANGIKLTSARTAADSPTFIECDRDLAIASKAWLKARLLGIDTEFIRERTYWARLGLVQVSDGSKVWLVDPLRVSDFQPLIDSLAAESITKIFHSGSEDYETLNKEFECSPSPVIDTQIACAMLGQPLQLGYHHAVKWLLGIDLEKDHTRSNWLKRPLSPGQLRYAALDVIFLPMMAAKLEQSLKDLGRWEWMIEDVQRIQAKSTQVIDPAEAWRRIKGAGSLSDEGFAFVVELARWRERQAQKRDLARGFVISDAALLELARRQPSSASEMENIEGIHPKAVSRYADQWLKLFEQQPRSGFPRPQPSRLTGHQRRLLKAMKSAVSDKAAELGIDSALLASNKDLHQMLMHGERSDDLPERFVGWRKEVIADELLEIVGS